MFYSSIALSVFVLLAGCASPALVGQPVLKESAQQSAASPKPVPVTDSLEQQQLASALEQVNKARLDYKLQPGDLLNISVFQEKDMDKLVRVSGNGTISFPLAGSLKVMGLSVPDTEELLAGKLKDFLINPQVSVLIKEYGNKQAYVLGEVKKPGAIELPPERRLTVLEAITMAGGFTELAAHDRTKVLRNVDGKNQSFEIEISRITKKGDKSADMFLEPNDIIFVPQSFF